MSASQEKRKRHSQRLDGTEKKQIAFENEKKRKKRSKITATIVSVFVALFIVFIVVINSNLFYTVLPAVSVGGRNYTTAEFNYYYFSSYYNLMSQLGGIESASSIIDPYTPLDEQMASEDQTWADYFKESALESMLQVKAACFAAEEAGFTLSPEAEDAIAQELASFDEAYISLGYSSLKQYLVSSFGRGSSMKLIESVLRDSYTASEYTKMLYDSYSYSDEDLETYYEEIKDNYDALTYRRFFISGAGDEENSVDSETAMNSAKSAAEKMAGEANSEERFLELVIENAPASSKSSYEDPDSTIYTSVGNSLDASYSEWMLDPSRKEGDTVALEGTDGYNVLYFISRDNNSYNVRMARHILIKGIEEETEDSDTEDLTEEELSNLEDQRIENAKAAALSRAEEIYQQWKDGEATEDSFAELANEYSEDTGSNTNGGLYDAIYKSQMVDEFDAFVFSPERIPGDTGIVYGESSSYYGYHVMYYVGEGRPYRQVIAENAKKSEELSNWQTAESEKYTISKKIAFWFVG